MKAQNRSTVRPLTVRAVTVVAGVATTVLLAGCTAAPATPTPSASASTGTGTSSAPTSAAGTPASDGLTIDITIANDTVTPSGKKIDAKVGQTVVLNVTSDRADEIHAHTGGDGYELEVPANQPTTGSFTPSQPGSFEIESHHLGKVIVILNVS